MSVTSSEISVVAPQMLVPISSTLGAHALVHQLNLNGPYGLDVTFSTNFQGQFILVLRQKGLAAGLTPNFRRDSPRLPDSADTSA